MSMNLRSKARKSLPEDDDNEDADLRGAVQLKHLMEHPLLRIFSDGRLIDLQQHVQEDDDQDKKIAEIFGSRDCYEECVAFHEHSYH